MAISWGPWASGAGGVQTRLGVEWSQSPRTITSGTSSVTVTCRIYLGHSGFVQDSNFQLTLSGSYSGTTTHSVNRTGSGRVLLRSSSRSYAPVVGQRGHSALGAGLSAFIGGSPSLTSNYYSAAKPGGGGGTPQTRPAAPTGAIVTRISDTEIRLVWNNHPTSSAPYTGVKIERWDARSGAWGQVAAGGSSSQSWTDVTTTPNNAYRYRVRAYNSVGHSPYSGQSALVMNTPGAPSNVSARRIGSDVRLTWINGARQGAFTSTEIQHRADGGAWTVIGTGFGTSREDYLHESPSGGGTHQYRIRARADSLLGPWSNLSNVVAIEAPPAEPTILAPADSAYVPDTGQVVLSWRHNPTDGSDQTRAVVRYGPSASSLTTVNVSGDASSTEIPAPAAGPGGQPIKWYWDVQTYGSHASPSARVSSTPWVIGTPVTTILSPAEGEPVETSTFTVEWAHGGIADAQQTGYRVTFSRDGAVVGQASGSGDRSSWTWGGRLIDGETYSISVQTRDLDSGLWTSPAVVEFTVDLLKPPTPDIVAGWSPDDGAVNVTVSNPEAGEGQAEVIGFELWRATDSETLRVAEEWGQSLTARPDAMTAAAGKARWVDQPTEPDPDLNLLWMDADAVPHVWVDDGAARSNLVEDPRATTASMWETSSLVTITPTDTPLDGVDTSMRYQTTGAGTAYSIGGGVAQTFSIPGSGGRHAVSVTVKNDGSAPASVGLHSYQYDEAGSFITNSNRTDALATLDPGEERRLWATFYTRSAARGMRVGIVTPDQPGGLDLRYSRVFVFEGHLTPDAYRDGSSLGWSWSGTPDASASVYLGPSWAYAGDDIVQAGDAVSGVEEATRAALDALWEQNARLVSAVGVDESITDHAPPVGVTVAYRVLAMSAIPSVAESDTLLVSTTPHQTWIWLNWGPGWGDRVRMRRGGNIRISHSQEKVRHQYKGRRRRVEYLGDAVEDRVTVNVRLDPGDGSCTYDELIEMLDRPAPILYRDPTGRMWETSSDPIDLEHHARLRYVTFTLERTDG